MTRVLLDLSRLLSRVLHVTPTGVDRVEMAYARGMIARYGPSLGFAAVSPGGRYGRLAGEGVLAFLDDVEHRWENVGQAGRIELWRRAASTLSRLRPSLSPRDEVGDAVYLQATPHHLTKPKLVARILATERARFVCLVHDLIPIEYPEYARPGGAALHVARMETVTRFASGIIANSQATATSLKPWIERSGRSPLLRVATLGTHTPSDRPAPTTAMAHAAKSPYFVCVGTIEPRKNHLLLLNVWRRLSEQRGGHAIPRLIVVGRRGWENEQVVDMLDRCPALAGCVEERNGLSDKEMLGLLAGARALLLPSFAEGYGMPVTEAIDLGVPVLCSDLPALREAGGAVPDYLDPLDGPAWIRAIDAYTTDAGPRAAQIARMAVWQRPSWDAHMDIVAGLIEDVLA